MTTCRKNRILSTYRLACVAAVSMFVAGCDNPFRPEAPPPVIVTKIIRPDYPPECVTSALPWVAPPQGFEPLPHIAQREQKNHDHYDDVTSDHAICRAGLKAQEAQPKGKD